jgi:hypothetical protein
MAFQPAPAELTADGAVDAPNGRCYGRVLKTRDEATGAWDLFTARLVDTSAQSSYDAGPFRSRAEAEARIVAFLRASQATYSAKVA